MSNVLRMICVMRLRNLLFKLHFRHYLLVNGYNTIDEISGMGLKELRERFFEVTGNNLCFNIKQY